MTYQQRRSTDCESIVHRSALEINDLKLDNSSRHLLFIEMEEIELALDELVTAVLAKGRKNHRRDTMVDAGWSSTIRFLGIRLHDLTGPGINSMRLLCMRVADRDPENQWRRQQLIDYLWHGIGFWRA
jgi:hypothetical protein